MSRTQLPDNDGAIAIKLFDRVFRGPSWRTWRVWLLAVFGLPMTKAEAAIFTQCTARSHPPKGPAREAWVVAGRRSGKSRMAAFVASFCAAVRQYSLAPGEKGVVAVVAPGKRQAGVILSYTEALISMIPGVTIVRRTVEELELNNGVVVAVTTASYRTPRGFTVLAAIVDEVAFLREGETSANPDQEIIRALRPSLATVRGSLLLAISSPYAQRGMLFETHERHYGKETETLVWQAPTTLMNPTVNQGLIDQALQEDPAAASAEWLAEFRSDLESLFGRAALDAVIVRDRFELAPLKGLAYVGFIDPSGGSSDSFCLGIAHRDFAGRPILDLVREVRPPFSPEKVCQQFAADLKRYGCQAVFSDSYAAEWPREQFAKLGIIVEPSPLTRSGLYLEMVPMVNSGGCELLDHPRLFGQLVGLERRTGRTGKDSIDHRPGSHDDVANAACGALVMCVQSIGLRAPLPEDFTRCINPSSAASCAFLARGSWFPDDGHCRRHCAGLRAVLPLYRQHQTAARAAGEAPLAASQFLEEQFEHNSFTERFATRRAIEQFEGFLGE